MVQCTYKVHTNSVALLEMAQPNVEWCSVHKNGVALRRMALQNIRRSRVSIKLLSMTWNISKLWRIVELACGVTWRLSRRNHQKDKPQIEQRSTGRHDVIDCKDWRETITLCSPCVEESSLHFSQFVTFSVGRFFIFFSCRYCSYSLSFVKELTEIMTEFYYGLHSLHASVSLNV